MEFIFLGLSILFFVLGWIILCMTRGKASLNPEQRASRFKYSAIELYMIGNPFCRYNGRTNW